MKKLDCVALVVEMNQFTPPKNQDEVNSLYLFVHTLLTLVYMKYKESGVEKVVEALLFSAEKHKGVYRANEKTPFIAHTIAVAILLLSWGVSFLPLIIASILHDVYEDTDATKEEIIHRFGRLVWEIISSVSKDEYEPRKERGARLFAKLRGIQKLILLVCSLLLKTADRVHNLRTLENVTKEKKERALEETAKEFPNLFALLQGALAKISKRYPEFSGDFLRITNQAEKDLKDSYKKASGRNFPEKWS